MYILLLIAFFNSIILCDSVENGWKGVKPLENDKTSVDKLWGTPEIDDNGYAGYLTDEAFIQVNFTSSPCENNQYGRGKYNVAKDTVLNYTVNLKKMIKLSDFKFNREKYVKDTSGDLANFVDYINAEEGVDITVYIQEEVEYVTKIRFSPTEKDTEIFKCKNK
jgi:hypothetical protein